MVEVIIERWKNTDGSTDFLWSVWAEGRRLTMAPRKHLDAAACEAEALEFCHRELGRAPDEVTRL